MDKNADLYHAAAFPYKHLSQAALLHLPSSRGSPTPMGDQLPTTSADTRTKRSCIPHAVVPAIIARHVVAPFVDGLKLTTAEKSAALTVLRSSRVHAVNAGWIDEPALSEAHDRMPYPDDALMIETESHDKNKNRAFLAQERTLGIACGCRDDPTDYAECRSVCKMDPAVVRAVLGLQPSAPTPSESSPPRAASPAAESTAVHSSSETVSPPFPLLHTVGAVDVCAVPEVTFAKERPPESRKEVGKDSTFANGAHRTLRTLALDHSTFVQIECMSDNEPRRDTDPEPRAAIISLPALARHFPTLQHLILRQGCLSNMDNTRAANDTSSGEDDDDMAGTSTKERPTGSLRPAPNLVSLTLSHCELVAPHATSHYPPDAATKKLFGATSPLLDIPTLRVLQLNYTNSSESWVPPFTAFTRRTLAVIEQLTVKVSVMVEPKLDWHDVVDVTVKTVAPTVRHLLVIDPTAEAAGDDYSDNVDVENPYRKTQVQAGFLGDKHHEDLWPVPFGSLQAVSLDYLDRPVQGTAYLARLSALKAMLAAADSSLPPPVTPTVSTLDDRAAQEHMTQHGDASCDGCSPSSSQSPAQVQSSLTALLLLDANYIDVFGDLRHLTSLSIPSLKRIGHPRSGYSSHGRCESENDSTDTAVVEKDSHRGRDTFGVCAATPTIDVHVPLRSLVVRSDGELAPPGEPSPFAVLTHWDSTLRRLEVSGGDPWPTPQVSLPNLHTLLIPVDNADDDDSDSDSEKNDDEKNDDEKDHGENVPQGPLDPVAVAAAFPRLQWLFIERTWAQEPVTDEDRASWAVAAPHVVFVDA